MMLKITRLIVCLLIAFCFSQITEVQSIWSQQALSDWDSYKLSWWNDDRALVATNEIAVKASSQADCFGFAGAIEYWGLTARAIIDNQSEIVYRTWCGNSINLTNSSSSDIQPHFNADGTEIVFSSNRDGNYEIYRIKSDGTGLQRLTNRPANDRSPDWSPTDQIVYTSALDTEDSEIWTVNSDGSNAHQLTNDAMEDFEPAWDASGQTIFWVRAKSDGKDGELWRMNADGSSAVRLAGPFRYLENPIPSPDGQTIAFDADITGDGANDLIVINVDGSNQRIISQSYVNNYGSYLVVGEYWAATWSPDSRSIIYSTPEYLVTRQGVTLQSLTNYYKCVDQNSYCPPFFAEDLLSYALDAVNLDPYPPASQLHPLPSYSRSDYLVLSWDMSDRGPAGIKTIEPQIKNSLYPNWKTLYSDNTVVSSSATRYRVPYYGTESASFRMHVIDAAENVEPYPAGDIAETQTTYFSSLLTGTFVDNRGYPIRNQPIKLQPAGMEAMRSDDAGKFSTHIKDVGSYVLQDNIYLDMSRDVNQTVYRIPADSVIKNGNFEDIDLRFWSSQKAYTQTDWGMSNQNAVVLVTTPCHIGCFYEPYVEESPPAELPRQITVPSPDPPMSIFSLRTTRDHVYAMGMSLPTGNILFSEKEGQNNWSLPSLISAPKNFVSYRMDVVSPGEIYFLAQDDQGSMFYSKRIDSTSWSNLINIGKGQIVAFAASPKGGFHIIYQASCNGNECAAGAKYKIAHRYFAKAGDISVEHVILDNADARLNQDATPVPPSTVLSVDQFGTLHIVHSEYTADTYIYGATVPRVLYTTRLANGKWSSPVQIPNIYNPPIFLNVDRQGTLTLFLGSVERSDTDNQLYLTYMRNGAWTLPELIDSNIRAWAFSVDPFTETIYALGLVTSYLQPKINAIMYRISPDRTLIASKPFSLLILGTGAAPFAVSGPNNIHYALPYYDPISVWSSKIATETTVSTISQSVSIPAKQHKPTLSFMYMQDASAYGSSNFEVSVTSNISTSLENIESLSNVSVTQVFSANTNTDWHLGWVDMSPWQGQNVTVTFQVMQAESDTQLQVYLDDVSLGSWKTPLPLETSPARIPYGVGTTLIITGENFIEKPSVKLGKTLLQGVNFIDEHRLVVAIPDNLSAAVYQVEVINPEGQSAIAPTVLYVGESTFLPLITR